MIGKRPRKPAFDVHWKRAVTRRDDIGHMGAVVNRRQMPTAMAGVHQCMQEIFAFIAFSKAILMIIRII